MTKKVLILSSTPRRGGNSDILCDRFADGARSVGAEVEKILLREKKIGVCVGCGACSFEKKPCPQKDDVDEIVDKVVAADAIVLATPVYFYSMSAQLKTLIDRFCARYEEVVGKDFYFIATAADDSKAAMERTFEGMRGFLDCLPNSKERGALYGVGVWRVGEAEKSPLVNEAFALGKTVVD